MFLYIPIAIAAIVLVFVAVVALQPADFRVARSTTISGPPSAVFAQVNDFHNWEAWNPWGKIDSAAKQTYEGASAGVGAIYTWSGNAQVGEGRMTITDSHPSDLIRIKLEFMKPFAATNTAEFTFEPQGNQTAVTWSMSGKKVFLAKAFHLFISCDKMIGGQFEKGLADMKAVVEAVPAR
jgi:carbon monoxide dehydrogenase subunit G